MKSLKFWGTFSQSHINKVMQDLLVVSNTGHHIRMGETPITMWSAKCLDAVIKSIGAECLVG